ncbi:MAG: peptidylprolyl isomerase [Acidobacteria bacterium]|nr:peptidylprolyl isomerase [Acidobacteriota bacterium]
MKRSLVVLAVLALSATAACGKKEAAKPAAAPAATPAAATAPAAVPAGAPKPVPAQLPDVLARVNGENVTRTELEMAVRTLEQRAQSAVPPEQRDAVYRQVLDRIIGFHLLAQEAHARKLVAAPWELDKQLGDLKKQFPNEAAFNQMLQSRGVTAEQLRKETEDTLVVNQMLQKEIEPQVKVQDGDLKTFYDQNKPRFHEPESVHASHILIRAEEQADGATKARAKAQAADLLSQIKKGAKLADLAKKFSQDPGSAQNGGDLGFFARGQMVAPFDQAVFALKPGQMSGVVETPFGYHIIQSHETKPARDVGFDEVKEQIREYLATQQREQKSQVFVDQLKAKGKITVLI